MSTKAYYPLNEIGKGKPGSQKQGQSLKLHSTATMLYP